MRQKAWAISKGLLRKEPNYVYYWLCFLRGISFGLVSPIYSVFLFSTGLNALQVNLINLVFVLSNLVFQIPAGALADSWGRKKTFLLSMLFNFFGFSLYFFGYSWQVFAAAEFLAALGYVLMTGILEAWVVDAWKARPITGLINTNYSFLFTRSATAGYLSSIIGGLAGGLIGAVSLRLPFLLGGIIFITVFLLGFYFMEEKMVYKKISLKEICKKSLKTVKNGARETLTNQKIFPIALFALIIMISFKIMDIYWAKRFVDLAGGRVWVTGYIWVAASLFMILGNLLLQKWNKENKSYKEWFIKTTFFAGIAILLTSFSKNLYPALSFFLLYETLRGVFGPSLYGYINNLIPSENRATIISFVITCTWIGSALGLIGLGWVAKTFSIATAWQAAAVFTILAIIPILKLKTKRKFAINLTGNLK